MQETSLKNDKTTSLTGTKSSPNGTATDRITLGHLFSQIQFDTPLQAVAASITVNKTITFCSIYLPPAQSVYQTDLTTLTEQLPSAVVLLGDFNGHSPLWGSDKYNPRGQMLENLVSTMNFCVLSNGSVTYIHPATGSASALDLSVCSQSLGLDYEWSTHDDLCGSDHFSVILTATGTDEDPSRNRWKNLYLKHVSSNRLPKIPWFNEQCKQTIKDRTNHSDEFLQNRLQRMCNTMNVYVQDHDLLSKNKRKRHGYFFVQNLTPNLLV